MAGRLAIATTLAAILMSGTAAAQSSPQATIYTEGRFKGASITATGPRTHIDPAFTAKSVKLAPGSAWELCSGSKFSGCRRVDQSLEGGVFSVRSMRPIAPVVVGRVNAKGSAAAGPEGGPANESLRGVASEFFTAPNRGGQRVSVRENKPERMRAEADEFCRAAGWRQSVTSRLQDVGGTLYLVDVLCANDAG